MSSPSTTSQEPVWLRIIRNLVVTGANITVGALASRGVISGAETATILGALNTFDFAISTIMKGSF